MSDPFIGQISAFAFTFVPRSWAACEGQILPISQNTALFSLIGPVYGGNGRSTFALPDFRGRVGISKGTGPGLSYRSLGQFGGEETHILIPHEMPRHSHEIKTEYGTANNSNNISGNYLSSSQPQYDPTSTADTSLGGVGGPTGEGISGATGGTQPHENQMPFLTLNYCISLQGDYPSRN
jgi:microcystin-dependent protein